MARTSTRVSKKQEVTLEGEAPTITPHQSEFFVNRRPIDNLTDELFAAGMSHADAVEEAFDFFLRRAGGHIFRVGEVWLTSKDARAMCVRLP